MELALMSAYAICSSAPIPFLVKMVKIYSTPACPYCEMAKDYFKEKNIKFEDYDVSVDEQAQKEMIEKSRQISVPVIDVDGKIFIGFNRAEIDKALNL